ncbi:TerC family protein [Buchnera aphidicola]|uniref:TerC family protein n=1 Tax=Buchnera aphidicola (Anoecia oenotherae) TaxID=1241833 RepID=A0A4D6XV59_9GAMM|nr:TerC family protein [Buchnera aphidicola]QCI19379.1 TerC family protein [Buchnera aphidicola (Anoecia oenotherae)]
MYLFLDSSNWAALLMLIVLEIVLGIDNLIFISILVKKLSPSQRDKARILGLTITLVMRITLLYFMSWIITLDHPLLVFKYFYFSGRDLVLLFGGSFLLFKAIMELHDKLDFAKKKKNKKRIYSNFWITVFQISILDAIFSLDSIITAVGMVNKLLIMVIAIVIATAFMLLASKILVTFINLHPTITILCLSFLIMIGVSLVSESFRFYIPKGYLYGAIVFSVFIECLNQIDKNNLIKYQSLRPVRIRASEAISNLIIKDKKIESISNISKKNKHSLTILENNKYKNYFREEEKYMINGVLTLEGRSIKSIMTPRREISWINIEDSVINIQKKLLDTPHNLFPVCDGELDKIIGVVRAKEILVILDNKFDIIKFASNRPPVVIPDTLNPINLLGVLRNAKGILVIVTNEFGVVQGLITPLDVLEAIAGEFPDDDETPDIVESEKGIWIIKGGTDLHTLERSLNIAINTKNRNQNASLAGLLISEKGNVPIPGDIVKIPPIECHILESNQYRIDLVKVVIVKKFT